MTRKNKHKGDERRFIIMSQAWYGDAVAKKVGNKPEDDEILIGFYCPTGGTSGEFSIKWRELGKRNVPYLKAFDDSWSALANFADVIAGLKGLDATNPTVEQVAKVLLACGVKDATPRESPYKPRANDLQSLATLLSIHLETFERVRELGREIAKNQEWAAGFEFNKGVLDGTKAVPREVVDELVNSLEMVEAYRAKLRKALDQTDDPELTAQYESLAYPK